MKKGSIKTERHIFTWQQVAVALVKARDVHEGLWRVGCRFDLMAAGVKLGKTGIQVPGAFIPIVEMNIARVETGDDLTVDAAEVNPARRILLPGEAVH